MAGQGARRSAFAHHDGGDRSVLSMSSRGFACQPRELRRTLLTAASRVHLVAVYLTIAVCAVSGRLSGARVVLSGTLLSLDTATGRAFVKGFG